MVTCPPGWDQREFGEERFWVSNSGTVQLLLGWGPPIGQGASGSRLQRLLATEAFPFRNLVSAQQVHGTSIAIFEQDSDQDTLKNIGRHDGMMSTTAGCGAVIWSADCVPVLISGGGAVSAIHAGWRGTAAGILPKAIELFGRLHGVMPGNLSATIGPAVGACHYPVGPEVITALERWAVSDSSWRQDNRIDLRLFQRRQLLDLGMQESAVEIVGPCTACDPRLASFRRDGAAAGRQISIIGLGSCTG